MASVLADVARVSVHLPVETVAHKQAAALCCHYYKFKYGGSTVSQLDNSPFRGTWRYTVGRQTKLFDAPVAILVMDIDLTSPSLKITKPLIPYELDQINSVLAYHYSLFQVPQITFYIVVDYVSIRHD